MLPGRANNIPYNWNVGFHCRAGLTFDLILDFSTKTSNIVPPGGKVYILIKDHSHLNFLKPPCLSDFFNPFSIRFGNPFLLWKHMIYFLLAIYKTIVCVCLGLQPTLTDFDWYTPGTKDEKRARSAVPHCTSILALHQGFTQCENANIQQMLPSWHLFQLVLAPPFSTFCFINTLKTFISYFLAYCCRAPKQPKTKRQKEKPLEAQLWVGVPQAPIPEIRSKHMVLANWLGTANS